jgi:hypothetical protein
MDTSRFNYKEFADKTSPGDFRSGEWFVKLLHYALRTYRKKATAEYFKQKYPGLPPDAIVDRQISLTRKYTAIGGGTMGAAYAGAIAATIGTHGAASPYTIPAAMTTLAADTCQISFFQLRLAHDISVLYGHPLDYEDPEDLIDLLSLAFGIKAGELFSSSLQKFAPEGVRVFCKKTATGANLRWLQALPVVGRHLLQRNIIKSAIPVVGIGLGIGINYHNSGKVGRRAKALYRPRAAIDQVVRDFPFERVKDMSLLLGLIWLTVSSDKATTREETWLLREFVAQIQKKSGQHFEAFEKRVIFDKEEILTRLSKLRSKERKAQYKAVCIAGVVDGIPVAQELGFLREVAHRAKVRYDEKALRELAMKFR